LKHLDLFQRYAYIPKVIVATATFLYAIVKVTKENEAALPTYLLDRDETNRSKILSNTIKQKRKEKAGKWQVPIPKVNLISSGIY
jgi:hypothetical protein